MSYQTLDFSRSITKKQIVALTGLMLIVFVIMHLAGNLFVFGGPKVFNGYADKLVGFGGLLKAAEWGLFGVFLIHVTFTAFLVYENIVARGTTRYAVENSRGPRSLATRLMPYSGTYLVVYLIWHLYDFTWASHKGAMTVLHGESLGLYGLVVNTFKDPLHAWLYVVAMGFLALHLAHGVESCIQTFGFNDNRFSPKIKKFSQWFALIIMLAYSSIPLYILYLL
jgi:succinate dehydrogenase / fumarate reductase cytochrome b subunit